MRNIKITMEYDGTNYSGWQRQKNSVAVQQMVESSINKITGENTEVFGCSRTDAGVHARAYIANFFTESNIGAYRFISALNSKLPEDIVIIDSEEVPMDFHARYSSKGKRYSYTILNRQQKSAINRHYVYHFRNKMDIDLIRQSVKYFIGVHDFSAFKNTGSSAKTTVRTITELSVEKNGDIIKFYISADGFLYNMARIIIGSLLNVGIGKIEPQYIEKIMESRSRSKAGKAVPAKGLCLEEVFY